MKKLILTLFLLAASYSKPIYSYNSSENLTQSYYDNAVTFVENGIRFHVFFNGDFKFDRGRSRNRRGNNRISIQRDYQGRVRRVGNVLISYNNRGDVRKIGSIYMQYSRGRLTRVGHLKIYYNRWGDATFYGRVRYNDYYYNNYNEFYSPYVYRYNDTFFYGNRFRNYYSQLREDDNFYYYKAEKDLGDIKKGTVIKRRKPTTVDTADRKYNARSSSRKRGSQ